MIYYVAITGHGHMTIVATKAEAKALSEEFSQIDVPSDKTGQMNWLQSMFDELNNNGLKAPSEEVNEEVLSHTEVIIPMVPETATTKSLRFEDEWENFPLKLKCHFAAKAMEECRSILG